MQSSPPRMNQPTPAPPPSSPSPRMGRFYQRGMAMPTPVPNPYSSNYVRPVATYGYGNGYGPAYGPGYGP
jgi:hypothetical protein